jgi:hypothetical protein
MPTILRYFENPQEKDKQKENWIIGTLTLSID